MVSIRIVCVGNLKEKYWKDAMAEYGKRLSRFCNFEVIETPESDPEKEKTAILKHLQGYVFSLCVEGKQCTSVEFARKIESVMQSDSKITFVIGGSDGLSEAALLSVVSVSLFNAFAVISLSIFGEEKKRINFKKILIDIIKNPLIISVSLGLVVMLLAIKLPTFAQKTLNELSDTVFALALMSLGAGFSFEALKGRIGASAIASLLKTVASPLVAVTVAVALGFVGVELGIILIFFGAPTAVSSYIMAKNMKSDYETASQILLISTLLCMFTLFVGIFILKSYKLI